MSRISSASPERRFLALLLLVGPFLCGIGASESRWYVSDGAGIAYERISPARAGREEWAVEITSPGTAYLQSFAGKPLPPGAQLESKILYATGKLRSRSTTLTDSSGKVLSIESIEEDGRTVRSYYSVKGLLTEEQNLESDGSATIVRWEYSGGKVLRSRMFSLVAPEAPKSAKTPEKEGSPAATGSVGKAAGSKQVVTSESVNMQAPVAATAAAPLAVPVEVLVWTDTYLYDRAGALRKVDRMLAPQTRTADKIETAEKAPSAGKTASAEKSVSAEKAVKVNQGGMSVRTRLGLPVNLETRSPDGSALRILYDRTGRTSRTVRIVDGKESSVVQVVYAGAGSSTYITKTVEPRSGLAIETSHDERGRVLTETRSDKDGKTLEKKLTTWADAEGFRDRVASVTLIAGGVERKTEYAYDKKGNRVEEREYRNGILERSIIKEGRMEREDVFRNGKKILSSVYENGVKKKDVRVVAVPVTPVMAAAKERRSPLGAGR